MGTVGDGLERSKLILFSLLKSSMSMSPAAGRTREESRRAVLTEGPGTSRAEAGHPAGRDSGSSFD